jgi:hypothetical protein
MFDGGGDHVALGGARGDRAQNGEIVCFGAAAGKDDFGRLRAEQAGDAFAGAFDARTRPLAGGMDGASVAEFGGKIRSHRGEDRGIDRRSGIKVEINAQGRRLRESRIAGRGEGVKAWGARAKHSCHSDRPRAQNSALAEPA